MKHTTKIHPYYIEMLFVILFLAISSIAVLQIHLATKAISNKNIDTQYAMATAQTAAELLYSVNTPEDATRAFAEGSAVRQGNVFQTQYNNEWVPVSTGGIFAAEKRLNFSPTEAGTMATLSITIQKGKSELYTLTAKRYFPSSTNNGRVSE
ncbi:hypothetical protein [Clostridium merdae]|uniref:hypothetical protein n=1 Tax=Clostridium merdae TaxID=1958780 RepID=UPI000A26A934|nr:hypothetical protein [Clostridium merdae]